MTTPNTEHVAEPHAAPARPAMSPPPLPAAVPPPLPHTRPEERRTAPRAELVADVSLYSETNFWNGWSEDLSEGGLFVATYDLRPLGTQFDLRFELPTGHEVRTRGEVRWHRGAREGSDAQPGMGIRFLDLAPADLAVIRSFVKHRSPLFFDDDDGA